MYRLASVMVCAAMLVSIGARAQSLRFSPKDEEPVEVTADGGFELQQDSKRVIARVNARAVQGGVSVTADQLIADYRTRADGSNEVYRVFASGNVTMKSDTETATGPAAVYDFDKAVLVLEGGAVALVSAEGRVTADRALQYWANERVAVAEGNAYAEDKNKHRLFGDRLIAFFQDEGKKGAALTGSRGDITYVQGFGNVRMETAKEIIRAQRGAYNIANGMATLDGGVKVTQGGNQLSGGFAVVNVKGGTSRVFASAAQARQPGLKENARVRALIAPKADPSAAAP